MLNYYEDGYDGDCSDCEGYEGECENCPYIEEPTEEEKEAQRKLLDEAIENYAKTGILPFEFWEEEE